MTADTGSRVKTPVYLVLYDVITPVGKVTVRPVPSSHCWGKFFLGCVAPEAVWLTVAAVAQILILHGVTSVP